MKELSYPFDIDYLLKNKDELIINLDNKDNLIPKRVAILGGSKTTEIKTFLKLFLLNYGISPSFYESDINKYYEDAVFSNPDLESFDPDIIYICTTNKNIDNYPTRDSNPNELLKEEFNRYSKMWDLLLEKFDAIIIQNNFELPEYRILGNMDFTDNHGRVNFINRLNYKFANYAVCHNNFYICDINYISSCIGLDNWCNNELWYLYRYAIDLKAVPYVSFNVANIIKSVYGFNKKAIITDLDNTIWGGIVGNVSVEGLEVDNTTSKGAMYYDFQKYLKELKNNGVLLNVNSKNDYDNAIMGINNSKSVLSVDDFIVIKANFEPKVVNNNNISQELNIPVKQLVYLDDSFEERNSVREAMPLMGVPEFTSPHEYIKILDRNGYFESTSLIKNDKKVPKDYEETAIRSKMMAGYENYDDYLKSLNMEVKIESFTSDKLERIAELINTSNKFNLTTKRYSVSEITEINNNKEYIKIYCELKDMFGDQGIVSSIIACNKGVGLHIDLWAMDSNFLKRNIEYVLMDELVIKAKENNIKKIFGYYYPTENNNLVAGFYESMGFKLIDEEYNGDKTYMLDVPTYQFKNSVINVISHD